LKNNFDSFPIFKLNIEVSNNSLNYFDKIIDSILSVLYIRSFIENYVNEINDISNYNMFNILLICLRYIPEDFKNTTTKIWEIKRKKLPINIIIIVLGDNFGDGEYLNSQISEFSNTKFIKIKDNSMDKLKEIVHVSLNHLKENI
jgi:UDP-galactopyranose mutase